MLTESSVGPDVPAAPVSAISGPCGAVGTNANPTHLVPLFCAFAFEVEGTQKRYYSSAYPPVAPLNMSQSPPRSAARDVASAAVEIDFKHICPLGPRQRRGPALALRGDDQ